MATVFWDSEGIVLIDYLERSRTITGTYYANLIRNVEQHRKRWDEESCDVVCHVIVITSSYVIASTDRIAGFELLRHPSYSPDLSPSNFCLFSKLKKKSWKDGNLLTKMVLSAQYMAGWRTKINNSSTMAHRESLDQVHFCWRGLCWNVTKYHAHILLLTISGYGLFECPSYIETGSAVLSGQLEGIALKETKITSHAIPQTTGYSLNKFRTFLGWSMV